MPGRAFLFLLRADVAVEVTEALLVVVMPGRAFLFLLLIEYLKEAQG